MQLFNDRLTSIKLLCSLIRNLPISKHCFKVFSTFSACDIALESTSVGSSELLLRRLTKGNLIN